MASAFPLYEFRSQQLQMALDVATTLQSGSGVFIAEAGTGTGKSLAYLIPAAAIKRTVVISTGTKNLQEQLLNKDIPLLNRLLDSPVQAVLLKGRQNYLCLRRLQDFQSRPEFHSVREKKMWPAILEWSGTTESGDSGEMDFLPDYSPIWRQICSRREECLGGHCPNYRSCFLLRLRIKAQSANLVIVNHHLFFADTILRQNNAISVLPDSYATIFDEAHLLEETVTQFLGAHIGQGDIDDFIRMIKRCKPARKDLGAGGWAIEPMLKSLDEGSAMFFGSMQAGEGRFDLDSAMDEETIRMGGILSERLMRLRSSFDGEGLIPSEFLVEWKEICRTMKDSVDLFLARSEPGMAWWGEHTSHGNYLHAGPVDISDDFPALLNYLQRPVILTSATLTADDTFEYFISRLGLHHAETRIYPSPFDYKTQGILYLPTTLPDPRSDDFYEACADEILKILTLTRGRAFILTTSYSGMEKLHMLLIDRCPYPMLVQGEKPKTVLIEEFRNNMHSVLLATISFWQGVDVPGESLSAVIIEKLPFASPGDPLVKARVGFMKSQGVDPFNSFQVPNAIMMLKQGVGRLIRSRSDRGLVTVLDRRILLMGYGRKFLRSLPSFTQTTDFKDVNQFFSE
ncbi:ATP-dependent DNA helicase [bacterium]|nr:ATP-dependent DNA helicase [candidate division CSSED10-310 bacterium]